MNNIIDKKTTFELGALGSGLNTKKGVFFAEHIRRSVNDLVEYCGAIIEDDVLKQITLPDTKTIWGDKCEQILLGNLNIDYSLSEKINRLDVVQADFFNTKNKAAEFLIQALSASDTLFIVNYKKWKSEGIHLEFEVATLNTFEKVMKEISKVKCIMKR